MAVPAAATRGVRPPRVTAGWALAAVAVLMAATTVGLLVGPVPLSPRSIAVDLASRLTGSGDRGLTPTEAAVVWQLRLPRVVLAMLVGGMLALAGGAYQGAFRNALADSYTLGVAAGAGLGATLAVVGGQPVSGGLALPAAAFVGGVGAVAATYLLGRSPDGRGSTPLVLAGVTVATFATAVQSFVQQRHSETLREVYAWLFGQLSVTGWRQVLLVLPYAALSAAVLLPHGRLLDVLRVGDDEARTLGVEATRVRLAVVAAATLGTAAAVAVSGLIAFVGIIVPHTVRLVVGTSYRLVLPLSLLVGAAFLVLADTAARTVLSPAELPIGVVTAFCGAPFFAVVLRTSRRAGL